MFRSTSDPVLSTAEAADAVPIKRRRTLNWLQALDEDDRSEDDSLFGGAAFDFGTEETGIADAEEALDFGDGDPFGGAGGEEIEGFGEGDVRDALGF